jgi:hypothetical protein
MLIYVCLFKLCQYVHPTKTLLHDCDTVAQGGYNKADKEDNCQFVLCHSTFHTGISHHRLLPNVVLKAMKGTPTHNAHMPMGRNTNTIP